MSTSTPTIEPELKPSEREELAHLNFFEARVQELSERGLISLGSLAQIVAETEARREVLGRCGRCRAALNQARKLAAAKKLAEARDWARQARQIDPDRRDAWELEISLEWSLERDAEAIELCTLAAEKFPEMADRVEKLHAEHRAREETRERQAEREREEACIAQRMEAARRASKDHDDPQAIAICQTVLELRPDHVDALAIVAFCCQRQGELDRALEHYRHLVRLQPQNPTWRRWEDTVKSRRKARDLVGPDREQALFAEAAGATEKRSAEVRVAPPPISWSSIAGEFLQEHWQKLILCLAVLLIVVSSTVGAQLLLGDRLWSPLGKCSLAMVGTLMFAALGMGLVRWGAERAGQMMLVTTLIVVPIHFILAGELKLVLEPSPLRLFGFTVQIAALLALARIVSGQLVPARDSWRLTVPLIVMSVFNATMARGVAGPWGWQFAAFQTPAVVFLAAVWGLRTRSTESSAEASRQFGNLFLGVLSFALVTSVIRTGAYALELLPTFYGVPLILTALACVHGARWISAFDPGPRQVALMKVGGFALAAMAFAVALARPLAPSLLLNGNTLAVAVIGLVLFVESLRLERQPAYLYMGFAAFFLAYFEARQALGYGALLAGPYRSINCLFFNGVLAALAVEFARRWKDARLVRHCHYIGVPLSVAACVYSGFDPKAALICMSGYTVLYLLASWMFAAPLVQYLAIAAMAGAAYFGSTLLPSITLGQQALLAAGMGLGCAVVFLLLQGFRASDPFRLPWAHGSLILSALAILGATAAMGLNGTASLLGARTFLAVSLAAAVLNLDRRQPVISYLALLCGNMAAALAIVSFDFSRQWGTDRYAIVAGLAGLAETCLGVWLGRGHRDQDSRRISASYIWPLNHIGLILAGLAVALCAQYLPAPFAITGLNANGLLSVAIALGASATTFAIGSAAVYRAEWLAHLTVWTALAAYSCGLLGALELARFSRIAATFGVGLAAVGILLFEIWDKLRPAHYRRPLLYPILVVVSVAGLFGFGTWQAHAHTVLSLLLAGLALVALVGEIRRSAIVYLALVAFLGVWLKATDPALGVAIPSGTLWIGLGMTSFNLILLGVAELLRPDPKGNVPELELTGQYSAGPARARLFFSRIPRFVVVGSFLGDALAWMNWGTTGWTWPIILMAAAGLLWASRFVRESALVYVGLWHLVAAAVDLACWLVPWGSTGILLGWLAVTLALAALGLWLSGVAGRKYGLAVTYWAPCLNTALGLTLGVSSLAVAAPMMTRSAYVLGAGALVLDALIFLLIATSRSWAGLIYPAVAAFTTASYVILLSVGEPDPAKAYVLGLNAVIHGLVIWIVGDVCRRLADAWPRACARPLFHSALILTILAIAPAYQSPLTMALVALAFLLTVKSLPSAEWIYPAAAAIGAAVYFPWLSHLPRIELLAASVVGAYFLWLIGLLARRSKTVLSTRLGLAPLDYELPPFNLAALSGLSAFLLKFDSGFDRGVDFTAHAWVPLLLSPLAILMVRAYPGRGPIHIGLALLSWGIISVIAPSLTAPGFLALAVVVLALGLQIIDLALRPVEQHFRNRLEVPDAHSRAAVRRWWPVLGVLGVVCVLCILVFGMTETLADWQSLPLAMTQADWWVMLAAFLLISLQVLLLGRDPALLGALRPEGLLIGIELTAICVLWWLGVASSPLAHRGIQPDDYYPLVTAMVALAIADVNERLGRRRIWDEPSTASGPRSSLLARLSSPLLLILALLGSCFTFGRESETTVATLGLLALALFLWAVRQSALWAAYLGGLAWSATGLMAGLVIARRMGLGTMEPRVVFAALGELAAFSSLGVLSGLIRERGMGGELQKGESTEGLRGRSRPLAVAIEQVGFVGSLVVAALVGWAASQPVLAAGWLTAAEIGALLAVALFQLLLTRRWGCEWPVYLAQASLLGAYVVYRLAHPLPAAADAAVLTLLAFVDLGIAEMMERLQLRLYARPARYASLVLPILPLVQLIGKSGLNEVTVFHLVAAGTFYAVACGTMHWKTLGYAAGVLYNGALWVLWSQMGWLLADHPQFYLVPVGLSAILFAEANRRDLGRDLVNTIRSAGLITTYLAMAAPIWQFRSFGDWVALLLGSLLGLFVGIGLRIQTFVWMGLVTFLADVAYELGRVSLDHALAKWAIMLSLGILLIFFVALNEKKQIVLSMRGYYQEVRSWE
jgi:tetratricopeptide (TPR) repeat protein